MAKKCTTTPTFDIPYAPETWTAEQLLAHRADDLEGAFRKASGLAGGWYDRPVTIDYTITADNEERYMLRPSEVPAEPGWMPCYEVRKVS